MSLCKRRCARVRGAIPLLIIAACLLTPGCRDARTSWSTVARDPHAALLAALVGVGCLVMPGCHNVATTWSAQTRSPDGQWVAIARTRQWGGPGTAYDATTVHLQRLRVSQDPIEILEFSQQYARMNLKMEWLTPTHLEVTYGPSGRPGDHIDLNFQVVKIAGIDVTVRDLSNPNVKAPL